MTSTAVLSHIACPDCGSSDALTTYDDGHSHCFSCSRTTLGERSFQRELPQGLLHFTPIALTRRNLTEETCRRWGYGVGEFNGQNVQVATYCNPEGEPIAQKIRFPNKDFLTIGDFKSAGLYGEHLWRDGGKMVVVTEGEIDALSVSQIQRHKWPVVSVPSGAAGASKAVKKSLGWLEKFERVVFLFDMDAPGRKAAQECALLMSPGKGHIASLPEPYKDASDVLQAGKDALVMDSVWGAKPYRPDGIVGGSEIMDIIRNRRREPSIGTYPHEQLNSMLRGLRRRELITVCAGSGIGKTEFTRELAFNFIRQGLKCGYVALEESVDRTALGLLGLALNRRLQFDEDPFKAEGFEEAWKSTIGTGQVYCYDHFGSTDPENLLAKIRYLRVSLGVDFVVLDHISIVVSGIEEGDERRTIDNLMTKLRSLVEETGVTIILVSHLKRPDGKGHEDGARTSLSQLRGSAAIGQLSDVVLGLERDQQDEAQKNVTTVRILKNRPASVTGVAGMMTYNLETGRMTESPFTGEDGGSSEF